MDKIELAMAVHVNQNIQTIPIHVPDVRRKVGGSPASQCNYVIML